MSKISLCSHCGCMTHTVQKVLCGKCNSIKTKKSGLPSKQELSSLWNGTVKTHVGAGSQIKRNKEVHKKYD